MVTQYVIRRLQSLWDELEDEQHVISSDLAEEDAIEIKTNKQDEGRTIRRGNALLSESTAKSEEPENDAPTNSNRYLLDKTKS
ncbi:hypothetical protein WA026_022742 [Henosepilachna vigintioctopunctata]|uniref:Uncharacterized protein n=1 Tax=Henosepilachna vigintioctopunctata TaxID=420089 RepID=A0AAW1UT31_9CUCU